MERVLLVLGGRIDVESVRRRCSAAVARCADIAICHVLPDGDGSLAEAISAQRAITAALRRAFGERAESIPVFVATNREGDGVEDCARAWGATEIQP